MDSLGNVVILGDSYSTYIGHIPEGYACYYGPDGDPESRRLPTVEKTWWHLLMTETGSRLLLNCSFSGSTICNTGYDGVYCVDTSFVSRAEKYFADGTIDGQPIQTILVFGGTNDSWANSPIGTLQYAEYTAEDLKYVLPAVCYLFSYLKEHCPGARIVHIMNCDLKEEITEGIRTACETLGVEYIGLHDIEKVNGHPNERGMRRIADQIEASFSGRD